VAAVNASSRNRGAGERFLLLEHRLVAALQLPIGELFWAIQQRKSSIADRLGNLGVAEFAQPRHSRTKHNPRSAP
jgi:hypothetical protein